MSSMRHDPFKVQAPYDGTYSHGVSSSFPHRSLHLSGQFGIQSNGELAQGFSAQCRQAILNLETVLGDANMNLDNLVKMNFYLTNRQDIEELVSVKQELLDGVRLAITTVIVAGLASPDRVVEVDAYAVANSDERAVLFDRRDAFGRSL
ncbi:MAG: hypothetical protein NPIRA05_03950 [Nitrospirales bacterium]|nr:MAG: hypothetical protein NPIRA05_03950 [Nitrospirales bacterium]